jgi:hypothetical protein
MEAWSIHGSMHSTRCWNPSLRHWPSNLESPSPPTAVRLLPQPGTRCRSQFQLQVPPACSRTGIRCGGRRACRISRLHAASARRFSARQCRNAGNVPCRRARSSRMRYQSRSITALPQPGQRWRRRPCHARCRYRRSAGRRPWRCGGRASASPAAWPGCRPSSSRGGRR